MHSLLLSSKERVGTSHNHWGFFLTHFTFLACVKGKQVLCNKVPSTLFALPGNYSFLSALKLDIWVLLNAIDCRQPFIFATLGFSFSISCVCPSFHVNSQAVYMKPTWKHGHAHKNAEKGSRGNRDLIFERHRMYGEDLNWIRCHNGGNTYIYFV